MCVSLCIFCVFGRLLDCDCKTVSVLQDYTICNVLPLLWLLWWIWTCVMEVKYRRTLCDLFSNKAERSGEPGPMQHCERLGCLCGQISIKGLDVLYFLKAASPQTTQGNVLDSRLRSVLKCSVVILPVKVIVTLSTPSSCLQSPGITRRCFCCVFRLRRIRWCICVSPSPH